MKVYTTNISKIDIRLTHSGEFVATINIKLPDSDKLSIDLHLQEQNDIEKFKTILKFTGTRHACDLKDKRVNLYIDDSNEIVGISNPVDWNIYPIDDLLTPVSFQQFCEIYD